MTIIVFTTITYAQLTLAFKESRAMMSLLESLFTHQEECAFTEVKKRMRHVSLMKCFTFLSHFYSSISCTNKFEKTTDINQSVL